MMTHEMKLKFVHQMTKTALEHIPHYDLGGPVAPTQGQTVSASSAPLLSGPGAAPTAPGTVNTTNGLTSALGIGTNFQGNQAQIQAGTNAGQLNTAYTGAQQGLNQQQGLVSATQPLSTQAIGSQGQLLGQLEGEAAGTSGPSPAQAQLNQNTGANIANTAALQASQRGAAANPGLIAQQAAQQGAQTQQNAVGQAATLSAQQQLAEQQQLQSLQTGLVGQQATAVQNAASGAQGEQSILQNANAAENNASVASQASVNSANAAAAQANAATGTSLLGGLASGVSAGLVAGAAFAPAAVFAKGGLVKKPMPPMKMAAGGVLSPGQPVSFAGQYLNSTSPSNFQAAGSAGFGGGASAANVGSAPSFQQPSSPNLSQAGIAAAQYLNNPYSGTPGTAPTGVGGAYGLGGQDMSNQLGEMAPGSPIPSPTSASDLTMPDIGSSATAPTSLGLGADTSLARGGRVRRPLPPMGKNLQLVSRGGPVKAENKKEMPKKSGDSYSNDTVPAMLSAGELVVDKDTMNDQGPIGQMARALAQHIEAKNSMKKRAR